MGETNSRDQLGSPGGGSFASGAPLPRHERDAPTTDMFSVHTASGRLVYDRTTNPPRRGGPTSAISTRCIQRLPGRIGRRARRGPPATTSLPWPTTDPTRFVDPQQPAPGQTTRRPGSLPTRFRRGRVVYCASVAPRVVPHSPRRSSPASGRWAAAGRGGAPGASRSRCFHQPDRHPRYVFGLVNFQPAVFPLTGSKSSFVSAGRYVLSVRWRAGLARFPRA